MKSYKQAKRIDAKKTSEKTKKVEERSKQSLDEPISSKRVDVTQRTTTNTNTTTTNDLCVEPPSPSREMHSTSMNRYKYQKRQLVKESCERINKEFDKEMLDAAEKD